MLDIKFRRRMRADLFSKTINVTSALPRSFSIFRMRGSVYTPNFEKVTRNRSILIGDLNYDMKFLLA